MKIETTSICIDIFPIVEQASDVDDGEATRLKINFWHQGRHKRYKTSAGFRSDLQDILCWQVQHRGDSADLYSFRCGDPQADQLPVIKGPRLDRMFVRLHLNGEKRASRGLGGCPINQFGKLDQQPAGLISNRLHGENAGPPVLAEHLARGETAFGLIGPELDCNLAAYPMRSSDNTDDRLGVQLLAPLTADRARNPPTSSSLANQKRARSLLLSTAARDPGFNCSLRSLRIALGTR